MRPQNPNRPYTDIHLRVVPGASRDQLLKDGGGYKVRLTAPAAEGKANAALIRFVAGRLRVPKGAIRIVSGETSRRKRIRIEGMTPDEVEEALIR